MSHWQSEEDRLREQGGRWGGLYFGFLEARPGVTPAIIPARSPYARSEPLRCEERPR